MLGALIASRPAMAFAATASRRTHVIWYGHGVRSVFVVTGAFLGRVDGETRCGFWADDPSEHGFDHGRLIVVDLARTPSAAAAGQIDWDQVEVDDAFSAVGGGLSGTTLGRIHTGGVGATRTDGRADLARRPTLRTSPGAIAV
jgi:hypothetical protein